MNKIAYEWEWAAVILGIMIVGLSASMITLSVSSSLQQGLVNYGNSVGTFIAVESSEFCPIQCYPFLPPDLIPKIASIPGVERVYPVSVNQTSFINPNVSYSTFVSDSAIIGNGSGFPPNLLVVLAGRLPSSASEYVAVSSIAQNSSIGKTSLVYFNCKACPGSDAITKPFNATLVGIVADSNILGGVQIFWNSTFVRQKLGEQLFQSTFGSNHINLILVKVYHLSDVEHVAGELATLLQSYSPYEPVYDQSLVRSLQSFIRNTQPIYEIVSVISVSALVGIAILLSYLIVTRRSSEIGLLVTQGWTRRLVFLHHFYYFLILSISSWFAASIISIIISRNLVLHFQSLEGLSTIVVYVSPAIIEIGLLIAIVVSLASTIAAYLKGRLMGLETMLRDY